MEARADLHLHSRASDQAPHTGGGGWFLRRIGSPQCFSEPEEVYRACRARGMQLVTLTDHDTLDGGLAIAHHPDTFLSCEVTAAFPEDGCRVHLLVYGLDEDQHREIQRRRDDPYQLRDYLREQRLPCAVAHALCRVDERFAAGHFERLLVLFDTFEGINGARHPRAGMVLRAVLSNLSPQLLAELASHHRLTPWGSEPWRKHLVAGSADHSGLYVASAWTETPAVATPAEFVDHLRHGAQRIAGETGSSLRLGRGLQQLAQLYLRARTGGADHGSGLLDELLVRLVAGEPPGTRDRLRLFTAGLDAGRRRDPALLALGEALREVPSQLAAGLSVDRRSFELSSALGHRLVWQAAAQAARAVSDGRLADAPQALAVLPAALLCLGPYAAALHAQHRDEDLVRAVAGRFPAAALLRRRSDCRAWFTDVADPEAPAVRPLLACAERLGRRPGALAVLTCGEAPPAGLPGRAFAPVGQLALAEGGEVPLRLPPLLEVVEHCERLGIEEVVVATPGPMGWCGWLTARLLGARLTVLHQVDLAAWLRRTSGSAALAQLAGAGERLLWASAQSVLVADPATAERLAAAGIAAERLRVLPRATDRSRFSPERSQPTYWRRRGLGPGCKVLYVGPLDAGLPLATLLAAFRRLLDEGHPAQLVLAGDGPLLGELSRRHHHPDVLFAGRLAEEELARAVASADLVVDLASADLRGQHVIDALASGVPVLIDERAGVAHLVREAGAGATVDTTDAAALLAALRVLAADPPRRAAAARAARGLGRALPDWQDALLPLLAESWPPPAGEPVPSSSAHARRPHDPTPGAASGRRASA
jgi:glycosyltransferase involved in cell wall biosynthesis